MRARSAMIWTCSVPLLALLGLAAAADRAWGDNDPPHNFAAKSIDCMNCHTPHDAPGGALTKVEGNSNLCM
ncbi:MAG: cytochrome c3 family protein, partial [Acidobacteriota bacterium]